MLSKLQQDVAHLTEADNPEEIELDDPLIEVSGSTSYACICADTAMSRQSFFCFSLHLFNFLIFQLGMDSMAITQLRGLIEHQYGVEVGDLSFGSRYTQEILFPCAAVGGRRSPFLGGHHAADTRKGDQIGWDAARRVFVLCCSGLR